jgi:hypothetical protein
LTELPYASLLFLVVQHISSYDAHEAPASRKRPGIDPEKRLGTIPRSPKLAGHKQTGL